jgi:hypothetical protein
MASARLAVELGYAIERDDGPSGKLGHWAVAGVPGVVMEAHSKRAAAIEAEMDRTGYSSYRARGIAARTTRAPKRHQPVGDLLPRWVAEMGEDVGDVRRPWSEQPSQLVVHQCSSNTLAELPASGVKGGHGLANSNSYVPIGVGELPPTVVGIGGRTGLSIAAASSRLTQSKAARQPVFRGRRW